MVCVGSLAGNVVAQLDKVLGELATLLLVYTSQGVPNFLYTYTYVEKLKTRSANLVS